MSNKLLINGLLKSFSPVERKEWEKAAISEINNDSPDEKLAWKGPGNINLLPYYDQTNLSIAQPFPSFLLNPSDSKEKGPRAWFNQPWIVFESEKTSNQKISTHLQQGADGFFIHFPQNKQADIAQLLDNIDLSRYQASFNASSTDSLISHLTDYMHRHRNVSDSFQSVTVFSDAFPDKPESTFKNTSSYKKLSIFGFYVQTDNNPLIEIKNALLYGVALIDRLTDHGYKAEEVIRQISFSLEAGNNFFYTVAKLKALRLLWFQVANSFHCKKYYHTDLSLHVRCEVFTQEEFQPHGNLLKGTSASLAAVLGGCNALSVQPEDASHEMMNRIARNISTVLREESHLHRVADPLAGAYFLEKLVHDFAAQAWEIFQQEVNLPR
jgi:methylmalonyl-CoA mutase